MARPAQPRACSRDKGKWPGSDIRPLREHAVGRAAGAAGTGGRCRCRDARRGSPRSPHRDVLRGCRGQHGTDDARGTDRNESHLPSLPPRGPCPSPSSPPCPTPQGPPYLQEGRKVSVPAKRDERDLTPHSRDCPATYRRPTIRNGSTARLAGAVSQGRSTLHLQAGSGPDLRGGVPCRAGRVPSSVLRPGPIS